MNGKTLAIVAYLTFIGWIIAFVMYGNENEKSPLAKYHLKQAFGLGALSLAISILGGMFLFSSSVLYNLSNLLNLGIFILAILGIINANNSEEKPLPIVGEFIAKNVNFIK